MSHPFLRPTHRRLDVLQVQTTHLRAFDPLEQLPNPFVRSAFWRRSRHAFEMDACGAAWRQAIVADLAPRKRCPIPEDPPCPGDLTQKHRQEAHDIWAFASMAWCLQKDPALRSDRANGREMVRGPCDLQNRRLTNWCVGGDRHRQHATPGFIDTRDGPVFVCGFLFHASHRCSFHVWIAASWR
jgi:hypothetical protein